MAILTSTNKAKPEEAASFVDQFEEYEKEIEREKSIFMSKCKAIRGKQKELLDDAKDKGWGKGSIKTTAKIRKKYRDIEALMRDQEDDGSKEIDQLLQALGGLSDLPLGKAAIEKVDPAAAKAAKDAEDRERTDAVIDAVQKDEKAKNKSGKKDKADDDQAWKAAAPAGSA